MAEEVVAEPVAVPAEDMDHEAATEPEPSKDTELTDEGAADAKRPREEDEEEEGVSKKQKKSEESVEEERQDQEPVRVKVGPKEFGSSLEMFNYFFKLLHNWSTNVNVNKYEHMTLLELIQKGHPEPEKKIGKGIKSFQVRYHPTFKSKCFFLTREDDSTDDFSFRKCVDHIIPLPEDMKAKEGVNKALGGGKGRGGRGGGGRGGRGRPRGGRGKH